MATVRKPIIGPWLFVSLEISLLIFNLILPESATNVKETNQYYLVICWYMLFFLFKFWNISRIPKIIEWNTKNPMYPLHIFVISRYFLTCIFISSLTYRSYLEILLEVLLVIGVAFNFQVCEMKGFVICFFLS